MTNDNHERQTEELDLWDVLKRIWNATFTAIGTLLIYVLRKGLWIIAFTILGIGFCVFLSYTGKKYYSSTVQMRSNVNSALIVSQIDVLNDLVEADKYEDLSLILQLPIEVVKEVKAIKGLYAIDADRDGYPDYADFDEKIKNNPQDTTVKKLTNYFYLNLEVFSDAIFPNVAKTLKSYIKKNEFLGREDELVRLQKQEMLLEIRKQVALLDSFQRVEYFNKNRQTAGSQNLFMLGDNNQQLYHSDYIYLYNQQQSIERDLELGSEIITVIQDFPPLSTPENPLTAYLKRYVWIFMILGLLCAIIWDKRKFIFSNLFGSKNKV